MELEAQRAAPAEGHEALPGSDAIPDGGELDKSFLETGEIDLLGEIFETLSLTAPSGRGLLYGTRSLDFCNMEEGSCYTRLRHMNPSEENLSGRQARDHECWLLAEEDNSSLEFAPPSSEEASLAEEEAGDSQHALLLPAKATRPASGMWDRGINEDEEGPPQPAERVAMLSVPWHKPFQLGEEELGGRAAGGQGGAGAELTPTTGSLGPPEEEGTRGHPEAATTGPESGQGVCRAEPYPKQDSPASQVEPHPEQDSPTSQVEPHPKQDSPASQVEPHPKQDSPASQVEPRPEQDSPASQVEPCPEQDSPTPEVQPRPKQDSPASQVEPHPEQDSPASQVEPHLEQDSPTPEVQPRLEQDSPAPEVEPHLSPDSPSSPRVQSAVALFQAKASRQTDLRGGVSRLGTGATLPSSSWPELEEVSQPPALPKVSELKKRFES